jgi:hypothetical protein
LSNEREGSRDREKEREKKKGKKKKKKKGKRDKTPSARHDIPPTPHKKRPNQTTNTSSITK